MKETFCSLNWQCPKCGKKGTFGHWPEGEELKIIFSCPDKNENSIAYQSQLSITFHCECGWEFRIWVEKEEAEH